MYTTFSNNPKYKSQKNRIQPKLTIGQPNDKYEQEADAMAEQVVRMPETTPSIQPKLNPGHEKLQMSPLDAPGDTAFPPKKPSSTQFPLEEKLMKSKGGGDVLPKDTLSTMNRSFGSDFSQVKVHTDADAIQMNQSLGAKAFTHGTDIYFDKGNYTPHENGGKKLLAHELTHVIQQKGQTNRLAKKDKKTGDIYIAFEGYGDFAKPIYTTYPISRFGGYIHVIRWKTNAKNGFIVQEIHNNISIQNCDGKELTIYEKYTQPFWEAWPIIDGKVTGGEEPGTDGWSQPHAYEFLSDEDFEKYGGKPIKGTWKTTSKVYYVSNLNLSTWEKDRLEDISEGPDMYFTKKKPSSLGAIKLTRSEGGVFSSCGEKKDWYHHK